MIKRLFIEIMNLLKSRVILLLFVLIMICTFFHNYTLNTYHENQLEIINKEFENSKSNYQLASFLQSVSLDDERLYFNTLNEYYSNAIEALENNEMEEYKRIRVLIDIIKLVPSENFYEILDPLMIGSYERYFSQYDYVQNIKEEMNFNEQINYISSSTAIGYDRYVFWNLRYDYEYYLSDAVVVSSTLQTSPSALIEYARDFHYISFVICAVFVASYSLYVDNKEGVLKTILVADGQRVSYIITKVVSCTIVVTIISLLAPVLVTIYKCGLNFFNSLDIPMLAYDKSLTSFKPFLKAEHELQYSDIANNIVSVFRYKMNFLPSILNKAFEYDSVLALRQLILTPMYNYLILISVFTSLFVAFITSLTIFFESLTKKRMVGIGAMLFIIVGLFVLSKYTGYGEIMAYFNPFSYTNIPALIEGSIPYTYLMGVLCLAIYTIVLIVASLFAFNRKDI